MQRLKAAIQILADLWAARWCLLTGHDPMTEHGDREVFQRCRACLLRSPGWPLRARPVPVPPTAPSAAARARRRIAAEAPAVGVAGWDMAGQEPDRSVLAAWQRVGPDVVFIGTLDDVMAGLVGELDQAGRVDDVQLLLMPTDGRQH